MKEKEAFLAAILAGDRAGAVDAALAAVARGEVVRDVYVEVLQESLYEVGRLWESNRISVAAEHLATAIVQFVLARLYGHLPRPEAVRGKVVLTGIEGELHQVGGHMVSDALESDGWDVVFLGTDVPVPDVLEAVSAHRPEVLGVSCMMSQNVSKVGLLVGSVRETFGEKAPKVVVGGGAFRLSPGRAAEVGADACARDLRDAIAALRALAARG